MDPWIHGSASGAAARADAGAAAGAANDSAASTVYDTLFYQPWFPMFPLYSYEVKPLEEKHHDRRCYLLSALCYRYGPYFGSSNSRLSLQGQRENSMINPSIATSV